MLHSSVEWANILWYTVKYPLFEPREDPDACVHGFEFTWTHWEKMPLKPLLLYQPISGCKILQTLQRWAADQPFWRPSPPLPSDPSSTRDRQCSDWVRVVSGSNDNTSCSKSKTGIAQLNCEQQKSINSVSLELNDTRLTHTPIHTHTRRLFALSFMYHIIKGQATSSLRWWKILRKSIIFGSLPEHEEIRIGLLKWQIARCGSWQADDKQLCVCVHKQQLTSWPLSG